MASSGIRSWALSCASSAGFTTRMETGSRMRRDTTSSAGLFTITRWSSSRLWFRREVLKCLPSAVGKFLFHNYKLQYQRFHINQYYGSKHIRPWNLLRRVTYWLRKQIIFIEPQLNTNLFGRWCAEGGELVLCDKCHHSFCKRCLQRNLGRKFVDEITDTDEWKCLVCDPKQVGDLFTDSFN